MKSKVCVLDQTLIGTYERSSGPSLVISSTSAHKGRILTLIDWTSTLNQYYRAVLSNLLCLTYPLLPSSTIAYPLGWLNSIFWRTMQIIGPIKGVLPLTSIFCIPYNYTVWCALWYLLEKKIIDIFWVLSHLWLIIWNPNFLFIEIKSEWNVPEH